MLDRAAYFTVVSLTSSGLTCFTSLYINVIRGICDCSERQSISSYSR